MSASFMINRLRVMRRGQAVYDEKFHSGVNIVRGENGSGKSTVADFIFYILGGEFDKWKRAAGQCDEVQAEISTLNGTVTVRRQIGKAQTPISVYFGSMSEAENQALDGWETFPIRRQEGRESFSQIMFRSSGIPEAQSQGSANITMNQILRLLYSDQRTPAALLFKYVDFDTREIREAVGDLVCGLSVYELYDSELKLRQLKDDYDDASTKLSALIEGLPADEVLANVENIRSRLVTIEREEQVVRREIEAVDINIDGHELDEFLSSRKQALSKLNKIRAEMRKIEGDVQILQYEMVDVQKFISYLEDLSNRLPRAELTSELMGTIEFTHCPACLSPVSEDKEAGHCIVCHTAIDPEREKSRYLSIKLDLDIQLREARQLLSDKQSEETRLSKEVRELSQQYEIALAEFVSRFDVSNSPRESFLAMRNQRLGQIGRDKVYLARLRERALEIQRLSDEKAKLQAAIDKYNDRIKALEQASKKRRNIALTHISRICRDILSQDLERQVEFQSAEVVSIKFGDNAISVDGEMNFADSSSVILKNAAILSLISAAAIDAEFNHPRFALFDNVEDKGMEPGRSHNFQELIVARSRAARFDHQIIYTTSMISPSLEVEQFTVGPHYTHSNRTLNFEVDGGI